MLEKFDVTIIGAGIVGLAVASEIPKGTGLVIERNETFGMETSSRNSEVIHAGIYYPAGFLKTKLCIKGNELVYKICKENNINHKNLGKVIVALNAEEEKDLEKLYKQGIENGVSVLRIISKKEIRQMEPNINGTLGLYSPTTGIVDVHNLMKYFEVKAKNKSVTFAYGCELKGIKKESSGYEIVIKDSDGESYNFHTNILINCAGLNSDKVAVMLGINDCRLHYCKGEYFKVSGGGHKKINHLVYPHPTETSLGIHTVLDLQGQLKLGPNAFYVDDINYEVNPDHMLEAYESARKYLPFIKLENLSPDMSGIRPKLQKEGEHARDFIIRHEDKKGL